MKNCDPKQIVIEYTRNAGVVTAAEIRTLGVHHEYLRRLCVKGELKRIGKGLYCLPNADVSSNHGFVQVAKAIPKGIICLLSALRFHEIGTQAPHEVWVALDRRAASPRITYPKVRIVRFSGKALSEGIEMHKIEGVQVSIYSPAKTVADCFKYRNKIGLDVALESLRDVLRERKCSIDELWRYAKICRVTNIMRPYMEATV